MRSTPTDGLGAPQAFPAGLLPEAGQAPSSLLFVAMLGAFRASGGTLPSDRLGRLIEDHPGPEATSLAMQVSSGQVFGFEWRGRLWIPMFQFDSGAHGPRHSVRQIRSALPAHWPGWRVALWFASPSEGLKGRRPVDLIEVDAAAVLRDAAGPDRHQDGLRACGRDDAERSAPHSASSAGARGRSQWLPIPSGELQ